MIIFGGIYTFIVALQSYHQITQGYEESSEFLKPFYGIGLIFVVPLMVVMVLACIVAIIGVILFWKKGSRFSFVLSFVTFFLALLMFNWVGSITTALGSLVGIIIWRHPEHNTDRLP